MEKAKKKIKFLKNRNWKSKLASRLKGTPEEICDDYMQGMIDYEIPIYSPKISKKWLQEYIQNRKNSYAA